MADNKNKPVNIIYGLDDKPPLKVIIPLVVQQIAVLSMDLVLPVIIISMVGGSREVAQNFVSLMMIGIGVGTILQVSRKGLIGAGYLCAEETGFLYFQASSLAVQTGGLSLLFGMTAISGVAQMLLSRIIRHVRFLFPSEVAGLMVAMTGIAGIAPGISALFGIGDARVTPDITSTLIGLTILMFMVFLNIWGNALMRQYSIFAGMILGYLLSYFFGVLTVNDLGQLTEAPFIAIPSISLDWSFDIRLLLPFLVAVICSSLKTMGNLVICQKTNIATWKRVDMKNVGDGVFTEGIGTTFCGFIGCMGLNSSSSSVGLSLATGVTSRYLAYILSIVFIAMAFFPKTAALLAIMPAPVMGAVLLINLGYFVIQGFQIITSRMLDDRKIFIVGLSLVFGLSVDLLPNVYSQFPPALQPLFKSSLTVVSLTAILLNLIFRIGIKQKQAIELLVGPDSTSKMIDFMESCGAAWGARGDVVHRASSAIVEFIESANELKVAQGDKIKLEASFDEYNLDIRISYNGTLLEICEQRPTAEELLCDDGALARLSGFLMRKYSNKMKSFNLEGMCVLELRFEH